ncbi:MAG: hypothetical protein PUB89_02210 [Oscillospiraceae bacterium]|nr:hypothetical protein [Oscillospiraceae bacterium]
MNTKEFLNRTFILDNEINSKLEKIKCLKEDLYGRGISYENSGAASSGSVNDTMARTIAKIIDFEHEVNELIDQLVSVKIEIEHAIGKLDDIKCRRVLERRYLFLEDFKVISLKLKYSKKHIYRLHNDGIKALEKVATE